MAADGPTPDRAVGIAEAVLVELDVFPADRAADIPEFVPVKRDERAADRAVGIAEAIPAEIDSLPVEVAGGVAATIRVQAGAGSDDALDADQPPAAGNRRLAARSGDGGPPNPAHR